MISPPNKNNAVKTSKVVNEVMMVRFSVWFSDVLTTSIGVLFLIFLKFYRMRSNTTNVSLSEYPITARIAAKTLRSKFN